MEKERKSKERRERVRKREWEKSDRDRNGNTKCARNAEHFGRSSEKTRKVKYTEWKGKHTIFLDGTLVGNRQSEV